MAGQDSTGKSGTPGVGWSRAGLWVSSGYFWLFGGTGALLPFTALYYRELGFSGWQVGVLAALPALALALSGPLWGAFVDARSMHRAVLRVAMLGAAVVCLVASVPEAFLLLLPLMAMLAILEAPIAPMLDGYGVTVSERIGVSYGRLRIWGSVGYTLSVLVVGWLMGDDVTRLFFLAHAACLGFGFVSTLGLPALGERTSRSVLAGLRAATGNRPLLAFLGVTYLMSISVAMMYGFLGIHIKELGGSAGLVGLASALSSASELPIVALSGWLVARFGPVRLVALAIAVYAGRFVAFALVTDPVWILPVQLFHGFSFGAFLVASVTLVHRLAGREQAATAQALLAAMSFGFGSITGTIVGGLLLDAIGTVGIFRVAAGLLMVTLAAFVTVTRTIGFESAAPPVLPIPQGSA